MYVAMMTKYRIYEHFLLLGKISELFMPLKATLLQYVEYTIVVECLLYKISRVLMVVWMVGDT